MNHGKSKLNKCVFKGHFDKKIVTLLPIGEYLLVACVKAIDYYYCMFFLCEWSFYEKQLCPAFVGKGSRFSLHSLHRLCF